MSASDLLTLVDTIGHVPDVYRQSTDTFESIGVEVALSVAAGRVIVLGEYELSPRQVHQLRQQLAEAESLLVAMNYHEVP